MENIGLLGGQVQPEHKAHWIHLTARIIWSQHIQPTQVPFNTYARVNLGITRDLGGVRHDAKLDRAPEASPMTSLIKDRVPEIRGYEPKIFVRPKPHFLQLPIPAYTRNQLTDVQSL
jgi:hypothetical protein